MTSRHPRRVTVRALILLTLVFTLFAGVLPASASPPQPVCFDVVAGLGGGPGTWSATGLVESSGTATFAPFLAGWDPALGMPATVHDRFVLAGEQGTITFQGQGKSALVVDHDGNLVPGYEVTWVILSGTGAYSNLRGQGDGYGWPDFASGTFPVFQCGQAHYEPAY